MKKLFLLSVFLISFTALFAQEQRDLQNYNRGKQLVSYGNWEEAMEVLRPYLDNRRYGSLSNYAHFHFARAAYGNGQHELAKGTLQTLLDNRSWQHQDEARYLLALSLFSQNKNSEALNEIDKIQDPSIRQEAERATFDFLQNANLSWMVLNLRNFGEKNKGFALALRKQLEEKTVMSTEERRVYNEVKSVRAQEGEKSDRKRQVNQVLEVAVVLPFNYNGGSGVSRLQGNNFVFEYYQGLKLAVEEAKKEGVDILIRTFDTERSEAVTERILEDPFFRMADVIVGPIYPEEVAVVSLFAEQQGIPQINPLSNLDDNLEVAEKSYLFRPSTRSMSKGILDYAQRKTPEKKIAIGYSASSKDELLAKQLTEEARRKGFQIVKSEKIEGRNTRDFFSSLGIERGGSPSANLVIILSDDPNVASPTFGVVESINSRVPILVPDSWLYFNFASFEMLEHQNIHFIGNNTLDFESPDLEPFREEFFEKYQVFPGIFAHLGYETIYWIQENLNPDKGFDFAQNLRRAGFQKGKLTFGFDFSNERANQYVPIMRLEKGTLEIE
ncbi:ABC transporter substrate-binding protein [Litoribacter alkaliphilus]|uniref:ABC transporter substrate-binding protein n=1 Tax=Litoribacter ruber TaxID=702568 RepID=A0AAP2CE69_9BACT|nr:ABC transporter substrate-binding protein [Litoribacter alkaliphilus]MBS9522691.1 ABC transporter substrate-binding protein [Litoribacter alkaliphilus]